MCLNCSHVTNDYCLELTSHLQRLLLSGWRYCSKRIDQVPGFASSPLLILIDVDLRRFILDKSKLCVAIFCSSANTLHLFVANWNDAGLELNGDRHFCNSLTCFFSACEPTIRQCGTYKRPSNESRKTITSHAYDVWAWLCLMRMPESPVKDLGTRSWNHYWKREL